MNSQNVKTKTNKTANVKMIALTAMFAALVTVFTAFIKIPSPFGYAHAGDSMIYLAASVLPGPYGALASSIGASLADLLSGYAQWCLPTFIIKAFNALPFVICSMILKKRGKGEKIININGTNKDTLETIIRVNDTIYIPIKEMKIVYNIETKYLEEEDIVIIDKLNEGMIKAEAKKEAKIRFRPRALSKNLGTLQVGETVSAFYTTSKGWRLIRTESGIVGYVKANVLTNEYIIRQDMKQETQTKKISINIEDGSKLDIEGTKVLIKDLLSITEEGILLKNVEIINDEEMDIWANLSIENADLSNFEDRIKMIKNTVSIAMKNNIKGINIIVTNMDKNLERFIIELAPILKEVGIVINIVDEGNIDEETYTDIVNYIITRE